MTEGCQSGRMGRPRKPLRSSGLRGFESHSFRQRIGDCGSLLGRRLATHRVVGWCRQFDEVVVDEFIDALVHPVPGVLIGLNYDESAII